MYIRKKTNKKQKEIDENMKNTYYAYSSHHMQFQRKIEITREVNIQLADPTNLFSFVDLDNENRYTQLNHSLIHCGNNSYWITIILVRKLIK